MVLFLLNFWKIDSDFWLTIETYTCETKKNLKICLWSSEDLYRVLWLRWVHPWAGEDLSLKIDDRDQTIWICILEL